MTARPTILALGFILLASACAGTQRRSSTDERQAPAPEGEVEASAESEPANEDLELPDTDWDAYGAATAASPYFKTLPDGTLSFVITDDAIGPLRAGSNIHEDSVRASFPAPFKVGENPAFNYSSGADGWTFSVYGADDTRLLSVWPDYSDFGVLEAIRLHASFIDVPGIPWHVGDHIEEPSTFDQCECWYGSQVCYRRGSHWAMRLTLSCGEVGIELASQSLFDDAPRTPEVSSLIWLPKTFPTMADSYIHRR